MRYVLLTRVPGEVRTTANVFSLNNAHTTVDTRAVTMEALFVHKRFAQRVLQGTTAVRTRTFSNPFMPGSCPSVHPIYYEGGSCNCHLTR